MSLHQVCKYPAEYHSSFRWYIKSLPKDKLICYLQHIKVHFSSKNISLMTVNERHIFQDSNLHKTQPRVATCILFPSFLTVLDTDIHCSRSLGRWPSSRHVTRVTHQKINNGDGHICNISVSLGLLIWRLMLCMGNWPFKLQMTDFTIANVLYISCSNSVLIMWMKG